MGSNTQSLNIIELAGQRIEYRLTRSKTAKKLRVRVGPGGVAVVLPAVRPDTDVEPFLRENGEWVRRQIVRVESLRGIYLATRIAEGSFLFRGEPTPVRVDESRDWSGPARIADSNTGIIILRSAQSHVPAPRSLENWLRKQARASIEAEIAAVAPKLRVTPNRVYLMEQRTKWGNCSSKGNLSFNWRLICAPHYVLQYLVTHEVVHLAVPDHSAKFWLAVQSLCPKSDRARQWLCAESHRITGSLKEMLADCGRERPTS
jgi:predicted metal-dependent hydrolase